MIRQPLFANHKWVKKIAPHFLFWLIVLVYFAWGFGTGINFSASFYNILIYLPGFMIAVYPMIYFLTPRFLFKKKYGYFFAGLFIVLLLCLGYSEIVHVVVKSKVFNGLTMREGRGVLPFIHIGGIAISINLLKYWYQQKQQTIEAEQKKTAAELELLKSQVHPHFLFNTLNNLYSHVLDQSPKAPEIVLKLSNLLRFMIYESSVPLIPLTKEIKLLQEYISLEQLRYGDRLDVSVTVTGSLEDKYITPLLMLPLVENAFKHGTSNQTDQCWISFDLHVTEQSMHFKLVNSKDGGQTTPGNNSKGIGLLNVKRRLDLLYNGHYTFATEEDKEVFIVNLEIQWDTTAKEKTAATIINQSINQQYEMEMFTG
ncbi:sensor histidine kinase [Ferruginibacter sp. SUN106]|uniref:sensor histidine kinase n=1 Tax=Ferruginibacter sp. SUN106 TaxID=2978348 RepID=UPI003D363B3E